MSISDRYRELVRDIEGYGMELAAVVGAGRAEVESYNQGVQGLRELQEQVGEIPRIKLESQLTPVLLKAHTQLDRARIFLDEQGEEDRAAAIWELEQRIYRLLNDL
ncbi:hypothetical protein DSOUD_2996 [Desulfuromonas soudanensis]|uniref:Uncharacterized protein n=1 Tax=Desulfuromonas soudanensis TaxID=1603606 RepID=A0A0M3QGF4_9BACT|nr:hypothetical protein [Desulfuromonas soudanensis]ALC17723.1 hypothetical protein DSOUD_2996 [Desulfuromonas soudanensis]